MLNRSSPGKLEVFYDSNHFVARLNGHEWRVDRALFGKNAKLHCYSRAQEHWIRVLRTASADVGLSTDFVANLQVIAGQWYLSVRFHHLDVPLRVPFAPWLEGLQPALAQVKGIAPLSAITGSPVIFQRRETVVSFTPDWCLRWRAEEPIVSASLHGLRLSAREACLSIGRRPATDVLDVLSEAAPQGAGILAMLNPEIEKPRAEPGQIGRRALSLTFDSIQRAEFGFVSRPDGSAVSAFTVLGEAEAAVTNGNAVDIRTDLAGLRLSPIALVQPTGVRQCFMTARVSRAAHSIETANLVLSVAGNDVDGIVTTFKNGLAPPLSIPAELHEAHVPVTGVDSAKITFVPIPFDIRLGSVGAPPPDIVDDGPLSALAEREPELIKVQARRTPPRPAQESRSLSASDEAAVAMASGSKGLLLLDTAPFFIAPLDKGKLQVLRSQDLLSLTFGFRNFAILVNGQRARLVPRRIEPVVGLQADQDALAYKLIVEFPPQHVAEHAKKTQLGLGSAPVNIDERDRLKGTQKDTLKPDTPFERVVRARLSRPTRLVFKVKPENANELAAKDLSIKTLTDWSDLAQVVSERALPINTALSDQMNLVGIDKGTNRAEALAKIVQSIRPPGEDETAIEFPYRLILSPDSRAKWIIPPHVLGAPKDPTPLWHARLDSVDGGRSVRAIWARDILLDFLRGNPPADRDQSRPEFHEPSTRPDRKDLTLSLSRSDRRELVTLSSVYALPALRRIVLDKDKALKDKPTEIGKNPLATDAAGTVILFPPGIGLWDRRHPDNPTTVKDEGVYVPKPLASADLLLTAMGGTFVGEGQWEPPSPIVYDPSDPDLVCDPSFPWKCDPDLKDNWYPSLRLERWRHRAVLGRDIFVEVSYKGFLFPIGHRASLLKVTERRFYPHPINNRPTAYLIQRLFILIGKREKQFPAFGQAHDGRLWPADTITMVTGRTPDIRDPEDGTPAQAEENGRIWLKKPDGADAVGLVFWPRVGKGQDNNFEFQFRKDADAEPIRAPLIFVDNVAAHIPDTMKALVETYYRNLPADPLRLAKHGSVRRRYAASLKDGETDFDTQNWELTATGRFIENVAKPGDPPIESFRMDGIMEGSDQPPYYPVMRTANITVQSLDRLVGKPAGGMTVAFNELFVRHAFAPDQNPSELFLDVLSPAIQLDFSGGGDVVGGFAKPSTRVVALSRKFGPVGGRGPQPGSGTKRSRVTALVTGEPQSAPIGGLDGLPPTGDFKALSEGRFDPKEFLGGADKLPKLLGIFSLADVLKTVSFAGADNKKNLIAGELSEKEQKVPKLQEQMSFGGGGLENQLADAKNVIKQVAEALIGNGTPGSGLLGQALADIDEAVKKKFGPDFNWRSLYPRLTGAFDTLIARVQAAKSAAEGGADLATLFAHASAVVAAGNALIAEAKAIRDNPMPPLVGDILATVGNEWEKVRKLAKLKIDGAEKDLEKIAQDLKSEILKEIGALCGGLITDPKLAELLFGEAVEKTTCDDFATIDPEQVYKRLSNALLYEIAGEPIARAHMALRSLASEISAIINDNARDVAPKLIALTNKVFDAALALARIAETSAVFTAAGELAKWCAAAIDFAIYISDELIGKGRPLSEHIAAIATQLGTVQLPAQTPASIRARVDEARAAAAQAHERAARAIGELEQRRADLQKMGGDCAKIAETLSLSGKILALRRDALAAIQDMILQAGVMAKALDDLALEQKRAPVFKAAVVATAFDQDIAAAKRAVADIVGNILFLLESLTSIGEVAGTHGSKEQPFEDRIKLLSARLTGTLARHLADIKQAISELTASATALSGRMSDLRSAGGGIAKWVAGGPFPADLAALGGEVLTYATQHDRRVAALVLQAAPTFNAVNDKLGSAAAKALLEITNPMVAVHDLAISVLDTVADVFDTTTGSDEKRRRAAFLTAVVSADVIEAFKDTTQIKADRGELADIKTKVSANATRPEGFAQADKLKKRWAAQEPALARSIRALARIIESLAQGNLSALIDLDRVRDLLEAELKKALAAFLPTKIEQRFDWKTELQPFPPVFKMVSSTEDDLTLSARVSIDLLDPGKRTVEVKGVLRPFIINILSEPPNNFLTLTFREARFTSVNGGKPDFDAKLEDVAIGNELQFIKLIESFFSYGDDSGFYVRPTIFPLGIEAGFEFSEDIVPLGGLILYNVGFSVTANLPFEDRDARFRFALASADAPLIISYPPYGGGGFVALTANGREFVMVECSFEFGAIVGLSFGPLSAVGRVMAGIYIRCAHGGGTYIKGFVHAVGEGSIACFSISVNIEVAIEHENGNMRGSSSYRFTFKVGFAEISYGFTATYKVAGSGGGGGQAVLFDASQHPMVKAGCHPNEIFYKVIERVPPKMRRWKDYRTYFDMDLLET
ncbi:hypothetical protein [Mesorhizobium sp. M1405]|uniref:hypothetical protein n=1 Tax=Mesorhizobium sp. M1405 TaxID=2957098 RepID=UPI003336D7F4